MYRTRKLQKDRDTTRNHITGKRSGAASSDQILDDPATCRQPLHQVCCSRYTSLLAYLKFRTSRVRVGHIIGQSDIPCSSALLAPYVSCVPRTEHGIVARRRTKGLHSHPMKSLVEKCSWTDGAESERFLGLQPIFASGILLRGKLESVRCRMSFRTHRLCAWRI